MSSALERIGGSSRSIVAWYNSRYGDRLGEMNGPQFALIAVSLLALLTAPLWGGTYLRPLALACIWAIFAMSWDIQSGYTGYISFGHSVLSGAAGYAVGLLVYNAGLEVTILGTTLYTVPPDVPAVVLIPLGIVVAVLVGILVAIPTLRLHGPYFSLVTLVAVLIFYRTVIAFNEYTNGENGIRAIDRFTFDPVMRYYYVLVPMLVVAAALVYVSRSNVGTIFVAIRENEAAVESAGIDTTKFKVWSFVLSSVPMGVGGVLLAYFDGIVNPATFVVLDRSIEMIAMAVLGGMSSILGPIGGAFLVVLLRDEVLHAADLGATETWIAMWAVVLVVIVFARQGLFRILWHLLGRLGGDGP